MEDSKKALLLFISCQEWAKSSFQKLCIDLFVGSIFPNQFALLDDLIPMAVYGCDRAMERLGDSFPDANA